MKQVDLPRGVVVVAGDVTIDWNIARSRKLGSDGSVWNAEDLVRAYSQRGGAALLADLVAAVAAGLPAEAGRREIRQTAGRDDVLFPDDERFHHSYAVWSLFPGGEVDERGRAQKAWRVEEFQGLDGQPAAAAAAPGKRVVEDDPEADLVLLDDAGLGFRRHAELWPRAVVEAGRRPWVLLKMAKPLAQGDLWAHLLDKHAARLIVVITINDLRRMEVQIGRQLSWEQTAQDLAWELVYNPLVNSLSRCAHVLVTFETAGAMLLSRAEPERRGAELPFPLCRLFFDPEGVEGSWQRQLRGGMVGYNTCLSAALARELMLPRPDLERGVQAGLAAVRWLHRRGYGRPDTRADAAALRFPVVDAAEKLAAAASDFPVATVENPARLLAATPRPAGGGRFWSILEDRYTGRLEEVAETIAREGAEDALHEVPLGRFGKLLTVDRREIESFRSIAALIGEYCEQADAGAPLSIAVFGAPGSGKSFAVTEVAESVLPGKVKRLTFNLSQFGHPEELLGAFHQVRDEALAGGIPLVFWDEFDTALEGVSLGWLRHFLAPMQDGRFQHGEVTHPIGRSIFVFAGGTSERLESFGESAPEEFVRLKGPDFVSRLKGYVDILGPNRRRTASGAEASDSHFLLRRAILLRSLLHRQHRGLFQQEDGREVLQIDSGVLRAFLQTRVYLHGARSLEAIVRMSLLHAKTRYERSSLPAEAQLELHVDARDFLALVRKMEFTGEALERLAAAAHEVFQKGLQARGETAAMAHLDYGQLPAHEQEQNRAFVRDIAGKLASIGYVMLPVRGEAVPFDFPQGDLDLLAEMEHDRWMKMRIADEWRWGEPRDNARKLHPALILWRALDEEEKSRRFTEVELAAIGPGEIHESEKQKDRDLVRGIPAILARNGFAVVKTRADDPGKR